MFGNYLIGLREGLEASLIVCILIAYLVKTGNRTALLPVWLGVGAAVALSLAFGAALEFGSQELTFEAQEALGGSLSIVSVGLVTWMVFWMRRTARHLRAELHGRLDAALAMGVGSLVVTAFLAVGREGLETALFVWTAVRANSDGSSDPLIGVVLGLLTAVAMGWLFYRGALRINLAKFFTWTGGMLVVVAAGVLAYGFHDLQEADWLPGLNDRVFDISGTIPPDSWYGTLLKGTLNFQPDPTSLQVWVWAVYLVPTLALFLVPGGPAGVWRAAGALLRPGGRAQAGSGAAAEARSGAAAEAGSGKAVTGSEKAVSGADEAVTGAGEAAAGPVGP
ncbi:iron uptake transporter permease EfeU [Streptomyces sp. B1866]|uniref:iron uptake transporter permease EfeU n=1 Tax=Streptomyces sp. B1866 TaxID=3075431 RepID=UPI00288DEB46|nr:iron uptake transporter permease EfeU [Streptomyces sp. B1866]MDT3399280.1 iron uptake transporter permease EfeU [Streptomyces sp. B1866]